MTRAQAEQELESLSLEREWGGKQMLAHGREYGIHDGPCLHCQHFSEKSEYLRQREIAARKTLG